MADGQRLYANFFFLRNRLVEVGVPTYVRYLLLGIVFLEVGFPTVGFSSFMLNTSPCAWGTWSPPSVGTGCCAPRAPSGRTWPS